MKKRVNRHNILSCLEGIFDPKKFEIVKSKSNSNDIKSKFMPAKIFSNVTVQNW